MTSLERLDTSNRHAMPAPPESPVHDVPSVPRAHVTLIDGARGKETDKTKTWKTEIRLKDTTNKGLDVNETNFTTHTPQTLITSTR